MSRTFRRKTAKPTNRVGRSHSIYYYVHDYVEEWNGNSCYNSTYRSFPMVKLEGKEYDKAYHKYHGDTRPMYGWGQPDAKASARVHNKLEVLKWMKNQDYEPVLKEYLNHSRYSAYD